MKDFAVGIGAILMGLFVTCGLFLGPPKTDDWMWWCLFMGPVAIGLGGLNAWSAWQKWPRQSHVDRRVVVELVQLTGTDGGFGNAARLRVIGSDIDRRGGIGLMREYYAAVRGCGVYFSQDIWDGIVTYLSPSLHGAEK